MVHFLDLATLIKTRHMQGGLVAQSAAGLPFLLEEGMRVALVPPVLDAPRQVSIKSLSSLGNGRSIVEFDQVTTRQMAEVLVGCHCLVSSRDVSLPESIADSWSGWEVYDTKQGLIGTVSAVVQLPGQALLEVDDTRNNKVHNHHTIRIPLVDEFLVTIDGPAHQIELVLPPGLLDL